MKKDMGLFFSTAMDVVKDETFVERLKHEAAVDMMNKRRSKKGIDEDSGGTGGSKTPGIFGSVISSYSNGVGRDGSNGGGEPTSSSDKSLSLTKADIDTY